MMLSVLVFAAALSAGNAEFEKSATAGAAEIAIGRVRAELAEKGPPPGSLERAMLAASGRFVSREEAKGACRLIYAAAVDEAFQKRAAAVCARLGLGDAERAAWRQHASDNKAGNDALFEAAFEAERKSACEKQAKTIAGAVRPTEAEFESKDEQALRDEMTEKVAAQQKSAVFEENLKYISETIVDPVIDSAKKEMKRQREYLTRTKCEAYAPSALAQEIEANLRKNVAKRQAEAANPAEGWGVFPKTLAEALPAAVEKRTLERVTKNADDVPVALEPADILKTIQSDPAAHRKASDSERTFRGMFTVQVLDGALAKAVQEAPAKDRAEFETYVRAHLASPELVRAVEARIRREVLPKWREVRAAAAKAEADRIWPALGDRTWYPDAELADQVAARSDYAAAVKAWRTEPALETLAKADGGKTLMEETAADADRSVSAAFDLARSAIAAQNAIVGEVEPEVLGDAKSRKASFWRSTPDLKAIVGMLTEAVEDKWAADRVKTLWGDGERPRNADEQHAALFPSVKRHIELVARAILEEMENPEPEPEKKPEPEEKPEDPTESDQESEEQLMMYSIVVERNGDQVTVKLDQGKTTVAERSAKAKMSDYQGAMKFVSDKLGAEILKLK